MRKWILLVSAILAWLGFFWFGHWAIMRPPLNWFVLAYTFVLFHGYMYRLYKEVKYHNTFSKFKERPFIEFVHYLVFTAPFIILMWTLIEVVERIKW